MPTPPKPPSLADFHPSEFMKSRHPDLFPDSSTVAEPAISREVFDYQLETLTKRKQETGFEHFCRKLAEKEICPNLRPQTGPTGGGDSKADSETYPVAEAIALRWYEGLGAEAARERWAFAFSAKRDWRTKVKGDINKIAETKRGYQRIFFISNQYVRDKDRAEVEDELSKQHHIPLTILDRTWVIKCIFENNRLPIAIETLHLTGYQETTWELRGPHDVQREQELKELEQQIEDQNRYQGVLYQLAEDCLQAALLARGLGRPRPEVDGRFTRPERPPWKLKTYQGELLKP